jgi:hypothetical protein
VSTAVSWRSERRSPGARAAVLFGVVLMLVAAGTVNASRALAFTWSPAVQVDDAHLGYGAQAAISGLSCPSASICVAIDTAGNVLTSTDPTAAAPWSLSAADPGNGFSAVSCASTSLRVALAGGVVNGNPVADSWTRAEVDPSAGLAGVSCPGSKECVAVDSHGNAVISTDPAAGASAWTVALADDNNASPYACYHYGVTECGVSLDAVSCPTVSFCAAADDGGNLLSTTDPTSGGAWDTVFRPDAWGDQAAISCPTTTFCAEVDIESKDVSTWDPQAFDSPRDPGRASARPGPRSDRPVRLERHHVRGTGSVPRVGCKPPLQLYKGRKWPRLVNRTRRPEYHGSDLRQPQPGARRR